MASHRSACACATVASTTPLLASPRTGRSSRPVRLLLASTPVEVIETTPSSSAVHVRVGESEKGWVDRAHLRIKCTAVRRSTNRRLAADSASGVGNAEWSKPFFFMQLADSQLGMAETFDNQPPGWAREEAMLRRAISEINRLRPAFAIVCGDLVNDYPCSDGSESELRQRQTFDFQLACESVDPAIPLVCVCGNHDVGNRPTPASITAYKRAFGDDYFSFTIDGVKCIVLNSQLLKDGTCAEKAASEQWRWLKEELKSADTVSARHVLCFCHVPPFINAPDEPSAYFNLEVGVREELLSLLARHRVSGCFCGHYHRNGGGSYYPLTPPPNGPVAATARQQRQQEQQQGGRGGGGGSRGGASFLDPLEVVVTGACGVNVGTKEEGNPLEIAGMGGAKDVLDTISGMRLVQVRDKGFAHRWYTFRELGQLKVQDVMTAAAVEEAAEEAEEETARPAKRRKGA